MTSPFLRRPVLIVACASALLTTGCVVAPYGPGYGYGYGDVVNTAPPPPQHEVYGVAPVLGHVWLAGYWGWGGGRHQWVPGHWSAPRAGHAWVPHAWVRSGNGWRMNPGHWRRH